MDDTERTFHVDDDFDANMKAGLDFWAKEVKPYIPQLYAQLRPIIGHDAPWTDEEYDHAVMKLLYGDDAEAAEAEYDYEWP